ncbi:MAG: carboxypeptidase-like regulatory domain-containing protein [Agriterribacter sp.]
MKVLVKFFLFFLFVCSVIELHAQKPKIIVITGIVVNAENGQPLEGASIAAKGSKDGTGTMPDGSFSVEVPDSVTAIVVTAEGFEQQEVKFGTKRDITVSLKLKESAMQAVFNQNQHDLIKSSTIITASTTKMKEHTLP